MQLVGIGYSNIREQNVGFLKQFDDTHFKIVVMNSVRRPGYEERNRKPQDRSPSPDSSKLHNSLSRSRSTVWELALCNDWEYFITLTISPEHFDRYDITSIYKALSKWINNYNSRSNASIKYLLIPEAHKDGAWHFHGLLSGLPLSHLQPFAVSDHIPMRLKVYIQEGRAIYNWPAYASRFGYVTLEQIRQKERCASYMTKYITKELGESGIKFNHHLYYCSKGLSRAQVLYRGQLSIPLVQPDYENE